MFTKPKVIIYIRRTNIIVAGKNVAAAKLNLPREIINNLDILDTNSLLLSARDFFSARQLKGKRVLIALDDSVVFNKSIQIDKSDKAAVADSFNAFVDAMPFNPGQRSCLQILGNDRLDIYATNSQLYEIVVEALKEAGVSKIISVTPTSAYKLDSNLQPAEAINNYLNNSDVQKLADFLSVSPV
jgi:hypothetical protein